MITKVIARLLLIGTVFLSVAQEAAQPRLMPGNQGTFTHPINPGLDPLGPYRGRSTRAQPFTWNADGTPDFGKPLSLDTVLPNPSDNQPAILDTDRKKFRLHWFSRNEKPAFDKQVE